MTTPTRLSDILDDTPSQQPQRPQPTRLESLGQPQTSTMPTKLTDIMDTGIGAPKVQVSKPIVPSGQGERPRTLMGDAVEYWAPYAKRRGAETGGAIADYARTPAPERGAGQKISDPILGLAEAPTGVALGLSAFLAGAGLSLPHAVATRKSPGGEWETDVWKRLAKSKKVLEGALDKYMYHPTTPLGQLPLDAIGGAFELGHALVADAVEGINRQKTEPWDPERQQEITEGAQYLFDIATLGLGFLGKGRGRAPEGAPKAPEKLPPPKEAVEIGREAIKENVPDAPIEAVDVALKAMEQVVKEVKAKEGGAAKFAENQPIVEALRKDAMERTGGRKAQYNRVAKFIERLEVDAATVDLSAGPGMGGAKSKTRARVEQLIKEREVSRAAQEASAAAKPLVPEVLKTPDPVVQAVAKHVERDVQTPQPVGPKAPEPVRALGEERLPTPHFESTKLAKGEGYEIPKRARYKTEAEAAAAAIKEGEGFEPVRIGDKYAVAKWSDVTPEIPRFESLDSLKAEYDVGSEISKRQALKDLELLAEEGPEFGVAQVGDKYYRTTTKTEAPIRTPESIDLAEIPSKIEAFEKKLKEDMGIKETREPTKAELALEEMALREDLKGTIKSEKENSLPTGEVRPEVMAAYQRYRERYVAKINEAIKQEGKEGKVKPIEKVEELGLLDDGFKSFKTREEAITYRDSMKMDGEVLGPDPQTGKYYLEPRLERLEDTTWEAEIMEPLSGMRRDRFKDDVDTSYELSDKGVKDLWDVFGNEKGAVRGLGPLGLLGEIGVKGVRMFYSKTLKTLGEKFKTDTPIKSEEIWRTLYNEGIGREQDVVYLKDFFQKRQNEKVRPSEVREWVEANMVDVKELVLDGKDPVLAKLVEGELSRIKEFIDQIDSAEWMASEKATYGWEHGRQIVSNAMSRYKMGVDSYGEIMAVAATELGPYGYKIGKEYLNYEPLDVSPRYQRYAEESGSLKKSYNETFLIAENLPKVFEEAIGGYEHRIWRDGHDGYSDIKNPIVRIINDLVELPSGERAMRVIEMQMPIKRTVWGSREKGWKYDTKEAAIKAGIKDPNFITFGPFTDMPTFLQNQGYNMGVKWAIGKAREQGVTKILLPKSEHIIGKYAKNTGPEGISRLYDRDLPSKFEKQAGRKFEEVNNPITKDMANEARARLIGRAITTPRVMELIAGADLGRGPEAHRTITNVIKALSDVEVLEMWNAEVRSSGVGRPLGPPHASFRMLDISDAPTAFSILGNQRGAVQLPFDIQSLRNLRAKVERLTLEAEKMGQNIGVYLKDTLGLEGVTLRNTLELAKNRGEIDRRLRELDPIIEGIFYPETPIVSQKIRTTKSGAVVKEVPLTVAMVEQLRNAPRDVAWKPSMRRTPEGMKEAVKSLPQVREWTAGFMQWNELPLPAFERYGIEKVWWKWVKQERARRDWVRQEQAANAALEKTFSIRERREMAIAAYAEMKGGPELLQSMGITEIPILTPRQQKGLDWFRPRHDAILDRANYVRTHTGQSPIAKVENYFTWQRQVNKMLESGIYDGLTNTTPGRLAQIGKEFKLQFNPYAQKRVKVSEIPLELDIFTGYRRYIETMSREMFTAPVAALAKKMAHAKIPAKAGGKGGTSFARLNPEGSWALNTWADNLMGVNVLSEFNKKFPALQKVSTYIHKNIVAAVLLGKVNTVLKQPSAFTGTIGLVGITPFIYGVARTALARPRAWVKGESTRAKTISDALTIRRSDYYFDQYHEMYLRGGIGAAKHKAGEIAGLPMNLFDSFTAEASWTAFYDHARIVQKMDPQAAKRWADRGVVYTQSMGVRGAIAPIQAVPGLNLFVIFQSFGITDFNHIARNLIGIKNPNVKYNPSHFKKVARYIAAATVINMMFHKMGTDPPHPAPFKEGREILEEGGGWTHAGLRGMVSLFEKFPTIGGPVKYTGSLLGPAGELSSMIPESVQAIIELTDWDRLTEKQKLQRGLLVGETLGWVLGVPMSRQIRQSIKAATEDAEWWQIILGVYDYEAKKKSGKWHPPMSDPVGDLFKGSTDIISKALSPSEAHASIPKYEDPWENPVNQKELDRALKVEPVLGYVMTEENSVSRGWNPDTQKWYPGHFPGDAQGVQTIAYGHVVRAGEDFSQGITQQEAVELAVRDIATARRQVREKITRRLKEREVAALALLFMNTGPNANPKAVAALNRGDLDTFKDEAWGSGAIVTGRDREGNRVVLPGLVKRRELEKAIWEGEIELTSAKPRLPQGLG
jgi:GH24 family phage-related lysozyme (muramidase)